MRKKLIAMIRGRKAEASRLFCTVNPIVVVRST